MKEKINKNRSGFGKSEISSLSQAQTEKTSEIKSNNSNIYDV